MSQAEALRAALRGSKEALRAMLKAEWMVSHDWGGDRAAILRQARSAIRQANKALASADAALAQEKGKGESDGQA